MAPNANQTESEPDYSQLYVYAGPEQPDLSNMTVYEHADVDFHPPGFRGREGVPLAANIIGSSHYISTGAFPDQYREMTSCRPIDMDDVVHYNITDGLDEVLTRDLNGYRIEITIQTREFNPPYREDNWDVVYTFGGDENGAPTAISFTGSGWETIHTYPEFDTELYTRTDFFEVAE